MILSISLPDGLTASAFAAKDDAFVFTALASTRAFLTDTSGAISDEKVLARPYNAIHLNDSSFYTAVGMHGERRVYLLDGGLNEMSYISISGSDSVNDALSVCICGEKLIAVTRRHSVEAFYADGSFARSLTPENTCRDYLSYVVTGDVTAYAYVRGGTTIVSVRAGNDLYSYPLPPFITFRSLSITAENEVHALLGYRYAYGIVYPVYQNGEFLLSDVGNLCSVMLENRMRA